MIGLDDLLLLTMRYSRAVNLCRVDPVGKGSIHQGNDDFFPWLF